MMMKSTMMLMGISSMLLGLSGCGSDLFTSPKENPVIEDTLGYFNTGPLSTLSTTSERRIFVVSTLEGERFGLFCAEPPADVAESLSSSFQAALEVKIPEVNAAGAAEIGKALATAVQSLAQRSQGLQLYRDVGYRLCEMYLNGVLTPAEYRESMVGLSERAFALVELELGKNAGKIGHAPIPALSNPKLQQLLSLAQYLDSELPAKPEPERREEGSEEPSDPSSEGGSPTN